MFLVCMCALFLALLLVYGGEGGMRLDTRRVHIHEGNTAK